MPAVHVVKSWSATKARDRGELDQRVTKWLRDHPELSVVDKFVRLSSDEGYHCLTIVVLFRNNRRRTR